jgi:GNAT superfamily N-acetyltransferase
MENVKIENIVFHPEVVEKVARWIYKEFVEEKGDRSLEFVIERFNNRNLDNLPMSFVAIVDGTCAGVVSIFDNDLGTRKDLTPWLAGLYVEESFRGNGIAEKLINTVINKCREMNFNRVYLRTEHAAEYYRKRGWSFLESTVDEYGEETSIFYKKL